jgi:nucleoside-diphosphate-sugar epimerase
VVGGSGLIGAHITEVLRERGHAVTGVARSAGPGVDHRIDLEHASVDELRQVLAGHDGVVLATRTEEQRPVPEPIYPLFRKDLVDPAVRLFTAARLEGLTRGAVMGSYYTYFDRLHPQWRLGHRHTYVRCRLEQAAESRAAAGPALPVTVVELPFVLGRAGDRRPNWAGPLDRWARSQAPLIVPAGGTAAVSARSVAEVVAGALERADAADLPVADENLTWHEMVSRIAAAAGRPRRVRRLPSAVVRAALRGGGLVQNLRHQKSGVDPAYFGDLLLAELFVEPASGRSLDPAFRDSFAT